MKTNGMNYQNVMKKKSTHTPEPLGVSENEIDLVLFIIPDDEFITQQPHPGLVML
jgi:hypothetical protein